jgi:hypothetical protein
MIYQPGESGNPAGRPRGARGKATILAQGLFADEAQEIIRAAIDLAKSGDAGAIHVCLDRIAPRARDQVVAFELPPLHSAASALSALADVAAAVGRGELTPVEADNLSKLLERYVAMAEAVELEERVARLEQKVGIDARGRPVPPAESAG